MKAQAGIDDPTNDYANQIARLHLKLAKAIQLRTKLRTSYFGWPETEKQRSVVIEPLPVRLRRRDKKYAIRANRLRARIAKLERTQREKRERAEEAALWARRVAAIHYRRVDLYEPHTHAVLMLSSGNYSPETMERLRKFVKEQIDKPGEREVVK